MDSRKAPHLSLGTLVCTVFGHRYRVSKRVTQHIKEYQCTCCGTEVTDTASGELAKLTAQIKETNSFLANFHQRRMKRVYPQAS